jgi:signal transduction histidine kinase
VEELDPGGRDGRALPLSPDGGRVHPQAEAPLAGPTYHRAVISSGATPGERVSGWMRSHELNVDCAAALVIIACCVSFGLLVRAGAVYLLLSVMLVGPLAVRRQRPVHCLVAVVVVALVQWLTVRDGIGAMPADIAVPVAVHAAVAHGPLWASRLGLASGLGGAVLGGVGWPQLTVSVSAHLLTGAFLASTVVAAWAIGALQRVRLKQVDTLAERARLLEVEREQRDRLAVLAERARIAREMHDIIAHSLAAVIAQADGGRYAGSPQAGTSALAAISDHARRALAETRRVLGVLRDGPDHAVPPQPGIEDLPDLIERVRSGGLDLALTLQPPAGGVEPGLSLVAYRIVQEGLTNVIKHAGPKARAWVSVRWCAGQLEIDVADDGRGPVSTGGGYGLMGMRERASAYGGTVTSRAQPGGGHVLSARIPVPA